MEVAGADGWMEGAKRLEWKRIEGDVFEKTIGIAILSAFVMAILVMVTSSLYMIRAKRVGIVPALYYGFFLLPLGYRLMKEAIDLYSRI